MTMEATTRHHGVAWRDRAVIRALRTPKGAIAGGWIILVVLGAIFAPLLTPYAYDCPASALLRQIG